MTSPSKLIAAPREVEADLAAAHLTTLPAERRASLERDWLPPAPYVISPERWAELNAGWDS